MKYFKEIDDSYLEKPFLVDELDNGRILTNKTPFEFYGKYQSIFKRIDEINKRIEFVSIKNRLMIIKNMGYESENYEVIDKLYSQINGILLSLTFDTGGCDYETKRSISRLFYNDYECSQYLNILDLFYNKKNWSYDSLMAILNFYSVLLELVNIDRSNLLEDIKVATSELEKLRTDIKIPSYEYHYLPDEWYILPESDGIEAMPYNTTGKSGHKDANLEYFFDHLYHGMICTDEQANYYFNDVRRLQNEDFVTYNEYMGTIKWGIMWWYHNPLIFDATGEKHGLRKVLLEFQRGKVVSVLENLYSLVPKEKKDELIKLIVEKSAFFNLLDSSGLPMGVMEIINKAFELAKDTYQPNYTSKETLENLGKLTGNKGLLNISPESYYNIQFYMGMQEILKALEEAKEFKYIEDMPTYIYNQDAKRIYIARQMAYGIVSKYFSNLYKLARDYKECLRFIASYGNPYEWDEVLVRCCGFNKIVRQRKGNDCYKAILTSNPDYEEEFKEYVKHGWRIDFLPPIELEEHTRMLRSTDDFYKVKRFH